MDDVWNAIVSCTKAQSPWRMTKLPEISVWTNNGCLRVAGIFHLVIDVVLVEI